MYQQPPQWHRASAGGMDGWYDTASAKALRELTDSKPRLGFSPLD